MTAINEKFLPLALYPLIATQGLFVKYRAAQLQEASGPRTGLTGRGPKLRLLILGDSSAAGVGVPTQDLALAGQLVSQLASDFTVDWQLVARCGDTTPMSLRRLANLPDQSFDVVVTALGVNDAKNGHRLTQWQSATDMLHRTCIDRFGARLVVASGLPRVQDFPLLPDPLRIVLARRCQQFDSALVDIVNRRGEVVHLPGDMRLGPEVMAADGFHPKEEVYAEWGMRAAQAIRAMT